MLQRLFENLAIVQRLGSLACLSLVVRRQAVLPPGRTSRSLLVAGSTT